MRRYACNHSQLCAFDINRSRGCVRRLADVCRGVWQYTRRDAARGHRRWQTMHNRWQAHKGAACGEVAPIIMCLEVAQHCSTSSTPNDSEVSSPRRLRYRYTSGYAWSSTSGAYYTSPFCGFCVRPLVRIAIRPYSTVGKRQEAAAGMATASCGVLLINRGRMPKGKSRIGCKNYSATIFVALAPCFLMKMPFSGFSTFTPCRL